jgi:hypothetical protein
MNHQSKIVKTLVGSLALLVYAWTEGAFCVPRAQTREACQNHVGYCSIFAWNYKIYYTKYYECCFNNNGEFTHKNVTGQSGPSSPSEGNCCQDLVYVSFNDGGWTLPCPQTHPVPD